MTTSKMLKVIDDLFGRDSQFGKITSKTTEQEIKEIFEAQMKYHDELMES